jgi:DNA-binding MarR family transcriptional regulator
MRTSTGTKAAADLQIALDAFRRIVQALRMDRGSARRPPGVSSAQLFALQRLAEHPGASINDLAALTFTHQSSVSVVVQRLVEQHLVARTTASDDRRRQSLEVTAQGRRLLRRAPAAVQERLIAALASLSAAERRALAGSLVHIADIVAPGQPAPPMFFEDRPPAASGVSRARAVSPRRPPARLRLRR